MVAMEREQAWKLLCEFTHSDSLRRCGFRRRRTLIPKGTRTAFRAEGEQFSERSDAGIPIVPEVFGFVKKNYPERSGGRVPLAEKGVRGKGQQPLCPCFRDVEDDVEDRDHSGLGSLSGLRFFRMDSARISMRWALWTKRSRMPSAMVGSPICSCQRETGSWEVRRVERVW